MLRIRVKWLTSYRLIIMSVFSIWFGVFLESKRKIWNESLTQKHRIMKKIFWDIFCHYLCSKASKYTILQWLLKIHEMAKLFLRFAINLLVHAYDTINRITSGPYGSEHKNKMKKKNRKSFNRKWKHKYVYRLPSEIASGTILINFYVQLIVLINISRA